MSLRKKSFRSGIAVMAASFVAQLLKAVSTIVLARLLEPGDFGLVSMSAVLIGATQLFSGMGMAPAVIASRADSKTAAYHAACITIVSGTLLMVLVMIFAPLFAQWFGRSQLAGVIQWMAVLILFQTLCIVPNALLMKEMMFGRLILPQTAAPLTNAVVAISTAYAGFGFWSLVMGQVAGGVIGLAVSLTVCPNLAWLKPQKWSGALAKQMGRFGLTTMGARAVQFVYNQGDYVVVGKALGANVLGFYTQAYNLANLPVETVSKVANAVLLPAYAKIGLDAGRLARAFLNSFEMVAVLSVPMATGLLILAPDVVIFLIGEKWRNSIPILQVYSILSFVRPLSGTTSPLFLAVNRPGYNFRTSMIQCVSMFALIFAFLRWGAVGVALGVASAFVIGLGYNIYLACTGTGLPIRVRDLLARVIPIILASGFMAGVVTALRQPLLGLAGGTHNIFSLGTLVLAGVLSYGGTLFVLNRRIALDLVKLVHSALWPTRERVKDSTAAVLAPSDIAEGK